MATIKRTIEEKAKAYDEVFKMAKEKYAMFEGMKQGDVLEEIFPELKESEDERIRKRLLKIFREAQSTDNWGGLSTKDIIAWLEARGEREPVVVIPKFRVGDVIRPKGSTAEYTIERISGECYHGKGWGLHISGEDDYELVGQKPAWSEEDETVLDNLIYALANDRIGNNRDEYVDWLNSLKDRVQPQSRQEWSEEDERIYNRICDIIHNAAFANYDVDEDGKELGEYAKIIGWLKSLKPQTTWKPSEEQIDALEDAIADAVSSIQKNMLNSLYQDIKKLKGE